jgi:RNA polymerase sigma factor (sigma-70 family)
MAAPPQLLERTPPRSDPVRLEVRRQSSGWPSSSLRASSDRRLARRASKGDRQAIATIFERYRQELYGFCLGLLGEPQDAQDALQNTMVKILRALPGEEREISLRPWLYRIAHNEAVELRRRSHPTQALDGHLVDEQTSVAEQAEQREQLEWLLRDLADLPERQRAVIVMRELNGLDFAEIGAALDTSGAVVRQSLYEARRNLEQMNQGRGMKCEAVASVLSNADRRITRRRDIRAHLRDCPDCRRFQDSIGRREGVLAAIPPLPAGAGIAQALLGGSGGAGTVAALTGGVTKSAGLCGALKAAGTLAAVAVIGSAAMQSQIKAPPDPSQDHGLPQARKGARHRPAFQQVKAVRPAHATSPPHRRSVTDASSPVAAIGTSVRRPHLSPSPAERGSALAAPLSPAGPPPQKAHGASPPAAAFETGPAPEGGTGSSSEKDEGSPAKQEKANKPESPTQGKAPPGQEKTPPGQEKTAPGQEKTPPGQAKKQAKAEEQPSSSASPPAAEIGPSAGDAEATQPAESPGPNGKAKGHEK